MHVVQSPREEKEGFMLGVAYTRSPDKGRPRYALGHGNAEDAEGVIDNK